MSLWLCVSYGIMYASTTFLEGYLTGSDRVGLELDIISLRGTMTAQGR